MRKHCQQLFSSSVYLQFLFQDNLTAGYLVKTGLGEQCGISELILFLVVQPEQSARLQKTESDLISHFDVDSVMLRMSVLFYFFKLPKEGS